MTTPGPPEYAESLFVLCSLFILFVAIFLSIAIGKTTEYRSYSALGVICDFIIIQVFDVYPNDVYPILIELTFVSIILLLLPLIFGDLVKKKLLSNTISNG